MGDAPSSNPIRPLPFLRRPRRTTEPFCTAHESATTDSLPPSLRCDRHPPDFPSAPCAPDGGPLPAAMKLYGKELEKDGAGTVHIETEDTEDLWHLFNLITVGTSAPVTKTDSYRRMPSWMVSYR